MKAFGIDISQHQGIIDFDKFVNGPIPLSFAAVRSGISWGYTDKWFSRNWQELKARQVPRTSYHILYPGESAIRQADNFFRILGDDIGEFDLVLDAELQHSQTKLTITNRIIEFARLVEARAGTLPILYSRTEWLIRCTFPAELGFLRYWPAQYLHVREGEKYAREHPGPPVLPPGFTTWCIHQTGDKTSPVGFGIANPPAAAATLDYNRFNGTEAEFKAFFKLEPEKVERTVEERLTSVEIWLGQHGYVPS
jgi:hypothetical protein